MHGRYLRTFSSTKNSNIFTSIVIFTEYTRTHAHFFFFTYNFGRLANSHQLRHASVHAPLRIVAFIMSVIRARGRIIPTEITDCNVHVLLPDKLQY